MKTTTLALSLMLLSMATIAAMPSATAQGVPPLPESPDVPWVPAPGQTGPTPVGDHDINPTDGWTYCHRIVGFNTCLAVERQDCFVWFSMGFGGCWYP